MATEKEILEHHAWLADQLPFTQRPGFFPWIKVYKVLVPQLPRGLRNSFSTMQLLELNHDLNQVMLLDLLASGEASRSYALTRELWGELGSMEVDEDVLKELSPSGRPVYLGPLAYQLSVVAEQLAHSLAEAFSLENEAEPRIIHCWSETVIRGADPLEVGDKMHTLQPKIHRDSESEFSYNIGVYLADEFLANEPSILVEEARLLDDALEYNRAGQEPPGDGFRGAQDQLLAVRDYLTRDKLKAFLRLVEEYNWEWACASYDWRAHGNVNIGGELRRLVSESPWLE